MNVVWHRKGDNPVDTHVLIRRSRKRPEWLEECLSSMEKEPTNILLVDSDSINVGKLRSEAMKLGDAPLLCFVDDDGRVVRGSFQKCIDELKDESLVGVYTDMYEITPEGEVFKASRIS